MPTCPNCGNKQQGTTKCAKCGSLFGYYTADNAGPARNAGDALGTPNASGTSGSTSSSKDKSETFWIRVKKAVGVREE
jgi:hypothetical protein